MSVLPAFGLHPFQNADSHDALLGSIIESPRNDLSDIGNIPWRSIVPQGQIRDREAAGTGKTEE